MRLSCKNIWSFAVLLALSLLPGKTPVLADAYTLPALPVGADGAVGLNIDWEAGTSVKWYIELQRYGAAYVDAGIHREDPALIQQGLHILDWGFAHQSADGSFSDTSDRYHSTTFFVEAAARATLELKAYHPSTYSLDASVYAATITSYTQNLHAAALWLLTPAAEAWGLPKNVPFTHRRWMLAAALAETSALTGDAALGTASVPFAQEGLSLQLGTGWTAAMSAAVAGVTPPATLVAPGTTAPDGTVKSINAEGVNPERGGYDVSYQCVGLLMAERYYPLCPDAAVQAQVKDMIGKGLKWEAQFVHVNGVMRYTGSTRMGLESDRSGNPKAIDLGTVRLAFQGGAGVTADGALAVPAVRIANNDVSITQATVADSGAVNGNAAFEAGTSASWSIAQQAAGVTFVEAGIAREDEDLIRHGLQIMDWGWTKQAVDGSFPGTLSPSWGTVLFVEAAARATLDLQNYHPTTYTEHTDYYAAVTARYTQNIHNTALWLTQMPVAPRLHKTVAQSASRLWSVAAAIGEAGQVTGDVTLTAFATTYSADAIGLQTAEGVDPEGGASDINAQAQGLIAAARYSALLPAGAEQTAVNAAITAGLSWENGFVDVGGAISGPASPLSSVISQAFGSGSAVVGDPRFEVAATRIESR